MKKAPKEFSKRAFAATLSAAMVVGMCPSVPSFAVSGSEVAADGTYNFSGTVNTDDDDEWDSYTVSGTMIVSGGKITSVSVTPTSDIDSTSTKRLDKAITNVTQKLPLDATVDTLNGLDTVSKATVSGNEIKSLLINTLVNASGTSTVVDATALNAAISTAESKTEADYTKASWDALQEKLSVAKTLAANPTTQDAVNSAANELNAAVTALVKAATVEEIQALNDAIKTAEEAKQDDYSEENWAALQTALTKAKDLQTSATKGERPAQADVTAATTDLKDAVDSKTKEVEYVWMNIPYDDFYEAELTNNDVQVDAFSSATLNKTRTYRLSGGSYHVDPAGKDITGVTYPVKLGEGVTVELLAQKGYQVITDDSSIEISVTNRGQTSTDTYKGKDALFEASSYAYYVTSETPSYYKEVTLDALGNLKFAAATGTKQTLTGVTAKLKTKTSYGDYQLDLTDANGILDADDTVVNGVVINAKDDSGKTTSYGLRHLENIWRKTELAWSTGFTTTVHGCPTSSAHYASMMGKTITDVVYYTNKGIYTIDIADVYVPVKTADASVSVETADIASGLAILTLNLPEGFKATGKVENADGINVDAENGKLTWTTGTVQPGAYTVTISDANGKYAPIQATVTLTTDEIRAVYDEENVALKAADGVSEENFKAYLNAITKVSVNGKEYSASGRGSVAIIDKETGKLNIDAKANNEEIFKNAGEYTIVVTATGYNTPVEFKYTVSESKYSYVYVGMTWAEYWANEGVYQAGNAATSDEVDTRKEHDKGAFDAVTRATANHGLHRGSFQCNATIYDTAGNTYNVSSWNSSSELVLTDGRTVTFDGRGKTIDGNTFDHYEITGLKYVPVKVKTADLADLKATGYNVVENGGTLSGGYGEAPSLNTAYSVTANVTADTYGLKEAVKNENGTFTFSARKNEGTESGIKDQALKAATGITPTVKEANGSYGEFLRVDLNGNYGDLGANMQAVTWTYYGNDSTYTTPLATYGTKFAADNWMHKSMGIQLGLTDSIRCKLPAGTDGTGYWKLTVRALGYADYTYEFNATDDNIVKPAEDAADTTALKEAVAKAEALSSADYSADSWNAMQLELQEAKELLAKENPTQAEVDEALAHLNAALATLERVPETNESESESETKAPESETETKAPESESETKAPESETKTPESESESVSESESKKSESESESKESESETKKASTSGSSSVNKSTGVKTGDPTSIFGLLSIAISSLGAGGIALTAKRKMKKKDRKNR